MGGSRAGRAALGAALEALLQGPGTAADLARDPLGAVRAWSDPADQEVAAVLAAGLAFGRVAAFRPVLAALMDRARAAGGPAAWARGFDRAAARDLAPVQYRWLDGEDLALLVATLGEVLRRHGRVGAPFEAGHRRGDPDLGPALAAGMAALQDAALPARAALGTPVARVSELPRGFRSLLASPAGGSPCKRGCMLLRWMVRRPGDPARADGLDLGLWDLPPARLVVPLDTHVHRLALLLGLTRRTDASWRTALDVTAGLRRLDPADPVRFDFALAHLGISGRCTVRPGDPRPPPAAVCSACALRPLCGVGRTVAPASTG